MDNKVIIKEYLDNKIEFKMIKGKVYANANNMADGDTLKNWKRSPNTKRYIEALENSQSVEFTQWIISKKGGNELNETGTWIHEKLVLSLARYISVEFELWCDEQITTLIREGSVSLKEKSEEEMLLSLFPSANPELIALTATSIRDTKRLTLENKVKEEVIQRKTELIDNMSEVLDEVRMRKIVTDYVYLYSRRENLEVKDVYNELYSFFGRTIKTDISHAKKKYIELNRIEVDKNKEYNRDNKLRGLDRKMPCTYHKPSTVEFITNILAKGTDLIYAMAKFFEIPVQQILDKYHSIEIEEVIN